MSALTRMMIAGVAVALFSAPAMATEASGKLDARLDTIATAQQACTGWGVRCASETTPAYCIADNRCAIALPAAMLVRYDQRMDALLGR
ncbi:MAG TPA: hypothetical protein GYA10_08435 [Alphaproteobacteria bacterium]|nr:hypothetical protein [Alphaproteobacteria bacterium]